MLILELTGRTGATVLVTVPDTMALMVDEVTLHGAPGGPNPDAPDMPSPETETLTQVWFAGLTSVLYVREQPAAIAALLRSAAPPARSPAGQQQCRLQRHVGGKAWCATHEDWADRSPGGAANASLERAIDALPPYGDDREPPHVQAALEEYRGRFARGRCDLPRCETAIATSQMPSATHAVLEEGVRRGADAPFARSADGKQECCPADETPGRGAAFGAEPRTA